MAEIVLSHFVEPELAMAWEYIAIDNPDAADRFLEAAFLTFQLLARQPGLGRPRRLISVSLPELRSFRVQGFENYLVFYRPVDGGIEVLHTLHGARDIDSFWKG